MRGLLLFFVMMLFFPNLTFAHQLPENAAPYKKSESCKTCHPLIYQEWQTSMHSKSSLYKDNAHAALNKAYGNFKKKTNQQVDYQCANCHIPMADKLDEFIEGVSLPTGEEWKETEGVGCSFCHRIDTVVHAERFNSYAVNKDGAMAVAAPSGKAPHPTASNPIQGNGTACMGCHSHLVMKGVSLCVMRDEGEVGDCLACHMESVSGKPSLKSDKTEHRSHVMGGGHHLPTLQKAVTLEAAVQTDTDNKRHLQVDIRNVITHTFPSTNPMRMAFLKVTAADRDGKMVWTNFQNSPMEDKKSLFMKVFRKGETMGVPPWQAETVGMDSRIKNGEKRTIVYPLPEGDIRQVTLVLIYRLFPPKAINKMGVPADGTNDKNHVIMKKVLTL